MCNLVHTRATCDTPGPPHFVACSSARARLAICLADNRDHLLFRKTRFCALLPPNREPVSHIIGGSKSREQVSVGRRIKLPQLKTPPLVQLQCVAGSPNNPLQSIELSTDQFSE